MAKLGYKLTEAELGSMMAAIDTNQNGTLEFEEFLSLYERPRQADHHGHESAANAVDAVHERLRELVSGKDVLPEGDDDESLMEDAFRIFDKDENGFITAHELQSIFSSLGLAKGLKLSDCHKMIRGVDLDGDGQVSFLEFKTMMKSNKHHGFNLGSKVF